MQTSEQQEVQNAAVILGKLRWAGVSKKDRVAATKKASQARMTRLSAAERSEIARNAASKISPEKAAERAKKAWETKRRKAAEK